MIPDKKHFLLCLDCRAIVGILDDRTDQGAIYGKKLKQHIEENPEHDTIFITINKEILKDLIEDLRFDPNTISA